MKYKIKISKRIWVKLFTCLLVKEMNQKNCNLATVNFHWSFDIFMEKDDWEAYEYSILKKVTSSWTSEANRFSEVWN